MEHTCAGHDDPQYYLTSLLSGWNGPSSLFNRTHPLFFLFSFFWLHQTACEILVPPPGIKLGSMAVKALVLTTGPPGNSRSHPFSDQLSSLLHHEALLDYCSGTFLPVNSPHSANHPIYFNMCWRILSDRSLCFSFIPTTT